MRDRTWLQYSILVLGVFAGVQVLPQILGIGPDTDTSIGTTLVYRVQVQECITYRVQGSGVHCTECKVQELVKQQTYLLNLDYQHAGAKARMAATDESTPQKILKQYFAKNTIKALLGDTNIT